MPIIALFLLTACGASDDASPASSPTTAPEPTPDSTASPHTVPLTDTVSSTAVTGATGETGETQETGLVAPTWTGDVARALPLDVALGPCMDVELADVDADGDIDVVLAMEGPANVVLGNDGSGRLTLLPGPFRAPTDSEHAQVADIDGDGHADLFFANEDLGGADELYLGDGAGGWVDASDTLPGPATSNAALVRDLDGDGWVDVVRGNAGQTTWWKGGPDGLTEVANVPDDTSVTQDVREGDLDGDGDLDLVLGSETVDAVWRQEDDGFVAVPGAIPGGLGETREVDLGDVNGDGHLDLVIARVGWQGWDPASRLRLGLGDGTFAASEGLPPEPGDALDLDLVDLDGDGDLDLLGAHSVVSGNALAPAPYTVWRNDGHGRFDDITAHALPDGPEGIGLDVEAADLDGDGLLDLYLCGRSTQDHLLFGR